MKAATADYLTLLEELITEGTAITMRVRGSSMLPAIANGAVVRLQPLSEKAVRLGEVVAIRDSKGKMLCHRVVRVYRWKDQTWVQTWGDICPEPDVAVPVSSVIGTVTAIVEDESERPVASRPAWKIRARYLKRALRRLLSH
ncbi:MAG: signal peptidase I [Armatimonadota bacterium]